MTAYSSKERGSSPLARGLLSSYPQLLLAPGIIPARAGFTSCRTWRRSTRRDHPRSRGVYGRRTGARCPSTGSSPLARGLREVFGDLPPVNGIIPARAGFTSTRRARPSPPLDHPRSRGVYETFGIAYQRDAGSSPLARGLHEVAKPTAEAVGIIPARAGFTCGRHRCGPGSGDHPRSRGVYATSAAVRTCSPGSSPLARGLLADGDQQTGTRGIIPARAGFTAGP